jgi:hypothetical protein
VDTTTPSLPSRFSHFGNDYSTGTVKKTKEKVYPRAPVTVLPVAPRKMQESLRLSRGSWEPTAAVFFVFWGQETCKKLVNVTRKWKGLCKGIWYTCNIWLFYVVQYFQFRYLKWPMRTVYFWWDVHLPIERCSEGLVYFILLAWFFRKSFRGAFATTLPAFARWTFDRTAFAEFFAVFGIKTTCDTCIYYIILYYIILYYNIYTYYEQIWTVSPKSASVLNACNTTRPALAAGKWCSACVP